MALYENNWRHVDPENMDAAEARLLAILIRRYGKGVFLPT